ncbi:MAG: hypothetical protein EXQ50_14240 [Acidobacteria bacterium]|nr:hypothetical protein [Acidobacteriota bacterium]
MTLTTPGQTGDYQAASGTLTIAAGQTSQTLAVAVNGDTTVETNETFAVNLSGASSATIGDTQGIGTIVDDDSVLFTDPTLVAGSPAIKAIHITELRTRVNAIRATKGLTAYAWTDPSLTVGVTFVKAVHILELRTALAAAYVAAGLTPPSYTAPVPVIGTVVTAAAVAELRAAVIAIP